MKQIVFFLIAMSFYLNARATDPCTPINISVTTNEEGTGLFSFTVDPDVPQGSNLVDIEWDFGDASPVVTNSLQSMTHQYYTEGTSHTVVVTCTYEYTSSSNQYSCSTSVVVPSFTWPSVYPCPTPVFTYIDTCLAGEMTFSWSWCDTITYGTGSPFWTADHVEWDFGDGTVTTTQGGLPGEHTFSSYQTYSVTGTVFFTGPNGEECEVAIANASGHTCELDYNPSMVHSYAIDVQPSIAAPEFYIGSVDGVNCASTTFNVFSSGSVVPTPANYTNWSYSLSIDGVAVASGSGIPSNPSLIYSSSLTAGDYLFELTYTYQEPEQNPCSVTYASTVTFDECPEACTNCSSFKPYPGERYWLSAWVKEDHVDQVLSYTDAHIQIGFLGGGPSVTFYPDGEIIEGWQRIIGEFTIPANTSALDIELLNDNTEVNAYFDDIRIHPFNASMKSYVYDPETFWLTAELDDNNYATFYEYDKEGQLIRIKKETARGIMTIQESRSNNPKQEE